MILRTAAIASACLLLLAARAAPAGPWEGKTLEKNGVTLVRNPAAPMEKPLTLTLEEAWRVGGTSEEEGEFFGVIAAVTVDPEGNEYLLDRQLSEVKIFSPDGEYLRTIGREGEGPGEFRRPTDLFFTPEGEVAVVQPAPGRLVRLSPEGDPAGDVSLSDEEGGFRMVLAGKCSDKNMILGYAAGSPQSGKMVRTRVLAAFDDEGKEGTRYFEQQSEMNFANPIVDETNSMLPTWALAPDGTAYIVSTFGKYEIQVWDADGTLSRVVERDFDHLVRSPEEKEDMKKRFIIRGPVDPKVVVSDHHPDIRSLHPREDGSLWVMTSRGRREKPDNSIGVFDVFDDQGRFVRQVTLIGEGDPEQDAYHIVGDRVFVVTQYVTAMQSMFGGTSEDEEDVSAEEPMPMEVICYRLPPLAAAGE